MVLAAMTEAQIQTLLLPDFTASLKRAPAAVEVLEEEAIPQSFWKPQPAKLDRQALLASLKEGATIAGVCLAASRLQLSVRTK